MNSNRPSSVLGICIGASTIKVAELGEVAGIARLGQTRVSPHDCHLRAGLEQIFAAFPLTRYRRVCVTGRKHKHVVNLPTVTEPEAVERALRYVRQRLPEDAPPFDALLSLGSENFIVYELSPAGAIQGVRTGNKCGSGTGEFYLQQLRRMDIPLAHASELARTAEPYAVCGRCSVFCKSDCTHALNKGVPRARVLAGLGDMIADKALEILGALPRRNLIAVGGVTNNTYVMDRLRERVDQLYVPPEADVFEALGAASCAAELASPPPTQVSFARRQNTFGTLAPLRQAQQLVTFRQQQSDAPRPGDRTILGLDVGSTTTKAALVRIADSRVLATVYLRTNGDPIHASRQCYQEIHRQLDGTALEVVALGVTGSGRHIAGLHAETEAVINEIIAHATGAAHFDGRVDTILEIGGQDAKYTYLINGVPCDYAMNEACSAGTGSFLEEAARESLKIDYRDIEQISLQAHSPPNFNDQCAAFISSDIKNASHDVSREDIVAGLVYSICMNYNNRVKGARKVGDRVFMQGGVCYNRAVPLAMASLLGKEIIVPPDPGMMGAFGVALEVRRRLEMGLLEPGRYDLAELADREVHYGKSFHCPGTSQRCDRGCEINMIELNGKRYPFGGACNKYYNVAHHLRIDPQPYDFVTRRQQLAFDQQLPAPPADAAKVGMTRSLLVNLLYPLYANFFSHLGARIVLSDHVDPEGMKRTNSAFCHPAVISHGMMENLLEKQPDFVFLPHVRELHVENAQNESPGHQCTCITVLAEPYYLKSAFPEIGDRALSPQLNFSAGWASASDQFAQVAEQLGCSAAQGQAAFQHATARQEEFLTARRQLGREALDAVERDPESVGIVLFGRPYNALAEEANMGIPRKFASRGVPIIPFDCLPFADQPLSHHMNWAMGQDLLRAARFVKRHPQLFGVFITNFGCGPDSFLVGYFRDIMRTKPSLTLEIDAHTADAGVNTRVEAFLDIVTRYRQLRVADPPEPPHRQAQLVLRRGRPYFRDSHGLEHPLQDPRVKVLLPSMGRTLVEAASAVFRGLGIHAEPVPHPNYRTLLAGRGRTSCKECLPLILTVGSLVEYLQQKRDERELLLYFMPSTNGNCRFPQYSVFLDKLIRREQLNDVATFTLTSENGYSGLGTRAASQLFRAAVVGDLMDDVRNALRVLAADAEQAERVYEDVWQEILECLARGGRRFYKVLGDASRQLADIPRRLELADVKRVLLAGEIFVRKDEFSSQRVIDSLAQRDIVAQRAPLLEWLQFVDYWVLHIERQKLSLADRLEMRLRILVTRRMVKRVKRILARSGLYRYEDAEIESVLEASERFVDRSFGGETNLVIGRFLKDMLHDFHGLISIGPFACMPTRIIDAILTPESKRINGFASHGGNGSPWPTTRPFLSIETDGNPFPQTIEAQLEAFCLQVLRTPRLTEHAWQ